MLLPNISAMKKWVNNMFPSSPNGSQDFLHLVRQSDEAILGWIDEGGIPRGSMANPPAALAGPGFINVTGANNIVYVGGYNVNGVPCFTNGSGNIGGFMFYLPTAITTNKVAIYVANNSGTSDPYDIGIYGPYTGVETTLQLVCHTGPQTYSSNGVTAETSWVNAPVNIPAGYYFLLFTTAADLQDSEDTFQSVGVSSGASAANLLNVVFAPTVSTTSTGSTLPSTVTLSVALVSPDTHFNMQMQFALF